MFFILINKQKVCYFNQISLSAFLRHRHVVLSGMVRATQLATADALYASGAGIGRNDRDVGRDHRCLRPDPNLRSVDRGTAAFPQPAPARLAGRDQLFLLPHPSACRFHRHAGGRQGWL